ncbi:hypothetical protein NDU88_004441 [Pleurodeles waltl]|uniref:Uncharacterized protein n=1 Tax=Pleurodeles waltl TaxID=8319 RepID=A0AAV7T8I5_PLEWA|nr:hypothetical protein NDU88_004441 [Pleurodeles waltl]
MQHTRVYNGEERTANKRALNKQKNTSGKPRAEVCEECSRLSYGRRMTRGLRARTRASITVENDRYETRWQREIKLGK